MGLRLTKYNYICRNYSLLCSPLHLLYVYRRFMNRGLGATGKAARATASSTPTSVRTPNTPIQAGTPASSTSAIGLSSSRSGGRTTYTSSISGPASDAHGAGPVTRKRPLVYPPSHRDNAYVAHSKGASSKLRTSDTTGTPERPMIAETKLRSRPRLAVASNSNNNNTVPRTSKVPVSENSTTSPKPKNVIPDPPKLPGKQLVKPRD